MISNGWNVSNSYAPEFGMCQNFDTWTKGSKTDSRTGEMQKAVKGNESGEGIVRGRYKLFCMILKANKCRVWL